jgi:hypothetical protein
MPMFGAPLSGMQSHALLQHLMFDVPPPAGGTLSAPKRNAGQTLHDYIQQKATPLLGKRIASKVAALPDYTPVGALTSAK